MPPPLGSHLRAQIFYEPRQNVVDDADVGIAVVAIEIAKETNKTRIKRAAVFPLLIASRLAESRFKCIHGTHKYKQVRAYVCVRMCLFSCVYTQSLNHNLQRFGWPMSMPDHLHIGQGHSDNRERTARQCLPKFYRYCSCHALEVERKKERKKKKIIITYYFTNNSIPCFYPF